MTKTQKRSGRFSLRLEPAIHSELASIADIIGCDLTGLVNMCIRDSLPSYRAKAAALRELNESFEAMKEQAKHDPAVARVLDMIDGKYNLNAAKGRKGKQ